jgi:ArsR family transcriptional regulator
MELLLDSALGILRATAEPTRLRLLALLSRAELTVSEIALIIGQSQPRISRHLKLLGDTGLLDRIREQHWIYYRVPSSGPGRQAAHHLLAILDSEDAVLRLDRERMERVLKERALAAASQWHDAINWDVPAEVALDGLVLEEIGSEPVGTLLDIGTGAGNLLRLLGPRATQAIGVDISTDALKLARTKVHGAGLTNCEFRRGDMYGLPFAPATFDTVTIDRVLGSAKRPVAALAEAARTLKPGGRLVMIEDPQRLAGEDGELDHHVRSWLSLAGLECTRLHSAHTHRGPWIVAVARRLPPSARPVEQQNTELDGI